MLCPKISTSWGKLAPTGQHGRHVFATLVRFFIEDLIFMAKKCWGQGKSEQNSLSTNTEAFFLHPFIVIWLWPRPFCMMAGRGDHSSIVCAAPIYRLHNPLLAKPSDCKLSPRIINTWWFPTTNWAADEPVIICVVPVLKIYMQILKERKYANQEFKIWATMKYILWSGFMLRQSFRRQCSEAPRGSLDCSPSPSTAIRNTSECLFAKESSYQYEAFRINPLNSSVLNYMEQGEF